VREGPRFSIFLGSYDYGQFAMVRRWVVGVAPGRINLPQFHCHTGSILHGSVLKLMEMRAC
jgi:hypothetical protein